jgi:hypothetical protein
MLSRPDIARLITARVRLALEFVPTEHEAEILANAFADLERLRNQILVEAEESDETETGSLLEQLCAAHTRAKISEKAIDEAAAVLEQLETSSLRLSTRSAQAPNWGASESGYILVAVQRLPCTAATSTAARRNVG